MARKMKDSGIEWIGEIPENWDLRRLKTVIESHSSGVWGKDESNVNSENNIICIRIADFDYPRMTIKKDKEFTKRNYSNSEIKKYKLAKGDILVEKSGGGEKTPVGRSIIWEEDIDALYANFIERLRVFEKAIFPKFLQYILYSFYELGGSNLYFNQTTGIQNLNIKAMLNNLKIPLPKRQAQNKIANFLDEKTSEIEGIKKELEKEIEVLEDYKKSIIYEAVTKGLDKNVEMKDSGVEWIGEIPKDWGKSTIKRYCSIKTGGTPSTTNEEWFNGELRWYTPADFTNNYVLEDSKRTLSIQAKTDNVATLVPKDTVLIIGIGATIGKIGFTTTESSFNQQITALQTEDLDSKYLMYWMIASQEYIMSTISFTTLPILNNEKLGQHTLIYPESKKIQKTIVQFLDQKTSEIDSIISDKKEQLQVLDEYKKSMIYEYVTGKKAVE